MHRLSFVFFGLLVISSRLAAGADLPVMNQAQSTVAVTGSVVDSTGAPVARARVFTDVANGARQAAITDASGRFVVALYPGTYTLRVHADGFDDWRDRLIVSATDGGVRRVVLRVAGIKEAVTVRAGAEQISSATKTAAPLRDVPQSVTIVNQDLIRDQLMTGIGDVVRYVPGISAHQGENNRDDVVIRGNRSSADFFVNGVRDDVQYYRDLYNVERVEALKGPNALIFGRGGGGGVVNRVMKEAEFQPLRAVAVQGGTQENGRITADVDQPFASNVAFRVNGMVERSESFRHGVDLRREGVNPTVTFNAGQRTKLTFGYEFLRDRRVADRGITSFSGRPVSVHPSTFYGDPAQSAVRLQAQLGSATLEHRTPRATIHNRTLIAAYDRFYQNFVPGAVSADRTQVTLTAYNTATGRRNAFNQTDIVIPVQTGRFRHTLLTGVEVGRQLTDNVRQTGFFNNETTSVRVPFDEPTISMPVTFRQNATDANNHVNARVAAVFVQDQVELSRHVQLLGGARVDRFDLRFDNHRTGETLNRVDELFSPRAGLVVKPVETLSLYGSYSVSHLPSSGDQFSSLTSVTQQVKPERFDNYEIGAKWEAASRVSLTTAVYRLDRTNTRATDPNDVTRVVQTGSQRTSGVEAGINGHLTRAWSIAGGYAYQDAVVTSATTSAKAGARVGQVPRHSFSLWNQYQLTGRLGAGLGVVGRSQVFATIDNTVILPGYTRADAAAFFTVTRKLRLQANIENVFGATYFLNADSNTNISPGGPRALRVALNARF